MANTVRSFGARYDRMYQRLLATVHERLPHRELTAFWPQVSPDFERGRDWLFVGQAVFGWESEDAVSSPAFSKRRRPSLAKVKACGSGDLSWVESIRSPFWTLIRWLNADNERTWKCGWSCHMAWSNLFKVAPAERGNPDSALREVQYELARELLIEEIRTLRPRQVVILAGLDWYEGFVDLTTRQAAQLRAAQGPAISRARIDGLPVPLVVAPHPRAAFSSGVKVNQLGRAIVDECDGI